MENRSFRTLLLTAIVVVLMICIAPFFNLHPSGLRAWRIARLIVLTIGLAASLVRELMPAAQVCSGNGIRRADRRDVAPAGASGRAALLEWNCTYLC